MGTTPTYSLPYPELGDPPDGAGQMKSLADAVDTALATQVANVDAAIADVNGPIGAYRPVKTTYALSINLVNDPYLVLPLAHPAGIYEIRGEVIYDAGAISEFIHTFALPAGAVMRYALSHMTAINPGGVAEIVPRGNTDWPPSYADGAGNVWVVSFQGVIKMGGTAGNCQFQFCNYVNGGTGHDFAGPSIYPESYMVVQKIG